MNVEGRKKREVWMGNGKEVESESENDSTESLRC